jgi:hypothetical protein
MIRRKLLPLLALLLIPWAEIAAQPPSPGIAIGRLKYGGGGDWYSNPTSLPNLARALDRETNLWVTRFEETRLSPMDESLFNHPFIYMNGHGKVRFTEAELGRLRTYLLAGGFLFADDNYGMDESFRREIHRVFPDRELVELPFDHPIYHGIYDFPDGPPKIHEHDGKPAQGFGIFDDNGRLMLFYTYQADIGDGLEDPDVHNDPRELREQAMRMAINVLYYALTS